MHQRFNRDVWASPHDFTGALAKCLVVQSPYAVPDRLEVCVAAFDASIRKHFDFSTLGMCNVGLSTLTGTLDTLLCEIPEIVALNERKNGNDSPFGFTSHFEGPGDPDDDFIDITAVAQNITCEFADREDCEQIFDMRRSRCFQSFLQWLKLRHSSNSAWKLSKPLIRLS